MKHTLRPPWWLPWRDPRIWAGAALAAGVAAAANTAWGALAPGRSAPTSLVALAAATAAVASLSLALHPRTARWVARGGSDPPVLPLAWAAVLAPPGWGPAFLTFVWTAAVLLWAWSGTRMLALAYRFDRPAGAGGTPAGPHEDDAGAPPAPAENEPEAGGGAAAAPPSPGSGAALSGRAHPTRNAGSAMLGLIGAAAAWVALCDQGLARHPAPWFRWPAPAALLAAAGALVLAAAAGQAAARRRAAAEGSTVLPGFSGAWWSFAAPAVALCLLVGAAWPVYPAPLQGVGLHRLVVAAVGRLGAPPVRQNAGAGGPAAAALVAACALLFLAAWPGRGLVRVVARRALRREARVDPEGAVSLRARWRMFWERLRARWVWRRSGRRPMYHGSWRPVSPPRPAPRPSAATWRQAPGGDRGRVRLAYADFLRAAASVGLRRAAADSPRTYLAWLLPRARPSRFPLQSLTGVYEEVRFSDHAVDAPTAATAEADARAAIAGLRVDDRHRSRPGVPAADATLRWTPPRGVARRRPGGMQ